MKRVFISFLALSMLLLSACNVTLGEGNWFRVPHDAPIVIKPEHAGRMTAQELLQTITLAVNDRTTIDAAFESIPQRQRQDITLSQFSKYITLIRRAVNGSIHSIGAIDQDAHATLLEQAANHSTTMAELASSTQFHYLVYRDATTNRDVNFAVALQLTQVDDVSLPYFSAEWMTAMLELYDFIELYTSAIESNNVLGLKALLTIGETIVISDIMDEALENKSRESIAFYQRNVISSATDYRLNQLLPGSASISHEARVDQETNRRETRTVSFIDRSGQITVVDKIPNTLSPADLDVYTEGVLLFRLADKESPAYSAVFAERVGIPLQHSDENCTIENGVARFMLRYPGITINGVGACDGHENWQGTIGQASLAYSRFYLGSGLKVGQPVSELYVRYPFARENNYLITGEVNGVAITLACQVEQGYITKITLNAITRSTITYNPSN